MAARCTTIDGIDPGIGKSFGPAASNERKHPMSFTNIPQNVQGLSTECPVESGAGRAPVAPKRTRPNHGRLDTRLVHRIEKSDLTFCPINVSFTGALTASKLR
ncbi:hypothetical protein Bbelb_159650 [Branchiostoma belcheri]|nr:hypothetical protein Bbelb_159650 [Branchiostoma belcheri]